MFPNPASQQVTLQLNGMDVVSGTLQITDAMGRVVDEVPVRQPSQKIDISALHTGVYTFTFFDPKQEGNKLTTRILVQK